MLLRQQQSPGSNLAFLRAHVSLFCVVVSCVSKSVAVHLNIALNWDEIQLFFSEYFGGFAWFPTLVTPNLTICSTARMHLRYISLTINLCFGPHYHLTEFGLEFFRTCRYLHMTMYEDTSTFHSSKTDVLFVPSARTWGVRFFPLHNFNECNLYWFGTSHQMYCPKLVNLKSFSEVIFPHSVFAAVDTVKYWWTGHIIDFWVKNTTWNQHHWISKMVTRDV